MYAGETEVAVEHKLASRNSPESVEMLPPIRQIHHEARAYHEEEVKF